MAWYDKIVSKVKKFFKRDEPIAQVKAKPAPTKFEQRAKEVGVDLPAERARAEAQVSILRV